MGILQGCIFFTTSTKMPQGPKIFCLALIVDMLYFFSPQPHILGISSNLYTYVKLYTFSSHLLKLTKSVQWLTHVAEITLVDKKSKKNCLTAKFWQKMPQCSLAKAWRIYTPGGYACEEFVGAVCVVTLRTLLFSECRPPLSGLRGLRRACCLRLAPPLLQNSAKVKRVCRTCLYL